MEKRIYVVGHRNPDTDSVASAIACAELKRRLGWGDAVAAVAGEVNPQTRYILERLGMEPPLYLADVHPKVRDVVISRPVCATADMPLRDALQLFHTHKIRVLPVVDESNRPLGIVSLLKLSEKYLVAGTDRRRVVDATFRSIATCLDGTFLSGGPSDEPQHLRLFIGAMAEESFNERIAGHEISSLMVMTGNRPTIQAAAIELGVRLLVLTGGYPVDELLLEKARNAGVTVISTPHDTATSVALARLSISLSGFVEPQFEKVGVGEPLENLRLKLLHSGAPAVIAVEADGTLAGVATKSSLLAPIPYGLILVDHNELGQAVTGAEAVEIVEIIDHHKLGNTHTNHPISFVVAPVGSTCTVVAGMYREQGLEPDSNIAALMLAGILSDTVLLKSPTTTARDRAMVTWLEQCCGLDHTDFGKEIFSACSGFAAHGSLEKALRSDFKHFKAGDDLLGVGQVEVVGFDEFHELKDELRQLLVRIRQEDRLDIAGLMVTDIYSETTLFLVDGKNELAYVMGYPQLEPQLYELKGVMSRKKQMVPHLLKVLGAL
ncbi:MAG TPA: putative manganese-dependent inorganic diphosphatase [Deltaproteobacteria bacterium]|nr:putative manganese-dependent inorganic diphosphatase [Deltaproteobacteria bacterium]